ncbi:MAG: methyltransferase domain-containing protein [Cocleimonas sp.]
MKLNLGCGNKKKEGFTGVDKYPCDAVDKLADLTKELPFEDNSIEEIWLDNVIEHIQDIPALMTEMNRICQNKAKVTIITPHFSSADSWRDPTHIHHLSYFSMDHFEKMDVAHYTGGGFKIIHRKLSFGGGIMGLIGRMLFKMNPKKYEAKWCFIFRAGTLTYTLEALKTK